MRQKEPTKGVLDTTLGGVAAGFALLFTGRTGCTARNRGDRGIACYSSSPGSTSVTDSLTDVACLAWSYRVANNSIKGAVARRGATHRPLALCSFCFFSFFFLFASFSSFSFRLFASLCLSSFSFFSFARISFSFSYFFFFPYFRGFLFLPSLPSPPLLHFPLFATVRRIHVDPS